MRTFSRSSAHLRSRDRRRRYRRRCLPRRTDPGHGRDRHRAPLHGASRSRTSRRSRSRPPSTGTTAHADGRPARDRGARPDHHARRGAEIVQDAVIATEDRSFWTNDGIDLGGVFRAFLTNVTSGQIEQGGSTITQQLVKNRILTSKRDVNRKIKEIEDALRLNEKFSKEKILIEYLNTVYFGQTRTASSPRRRASSQCDPTRRSARGKHLDELTIGEAALLAGVISNPEGNNPFTAPRPRHPPRAPTCSRARSTRATSRRPRPTPPTTSRCRPCRRRPNPSRPATSSSPRCAGPARTDAQCSASAPRRRAPRQGAQGRPEDLHDLRPEPAEHGRVDATDNAKPQNGPRLDRRRWCRSTRHRRGEGDGVGPGLRRQSVQHRHVARRPPDRVHVQGDHPRRGARERLLAGRHRRRHEPVLGAERFAAQRRVQRRAPGAASTPLGRDRRTRSTARSCASPRASATTR